MEIDHISFSQINMYLRCPAQYYFRYCLDIKLPPKAALVKGKAVHKAQEENYKQKIYTKIDLPLDVIQDITADTFEKEAQEAEFEHGEDKGKIKDEAISLATLYHTFIAPDVMPEAVEQEVIIRTDDFTLKGYIDVLQQGGIIRDTKTSNKTPNQDIVQKSLQLSAYSFAYYTLTNELPQKVCLDYLVSTKQPKIVTLDGIRTLDDINRFIKITAKVVQAIKNEIFYPNQDNMLCSPEWCGYWELCHKEF